MASAAALAGDRDERREAERGGGTPWDIAICSLRSSRHRGRAHGRRQPLSGAAWRASSCSEPTLRGPHQASLALVLESTEEQSPGSPRVDLLEPEWPTHRQSGRRRRGVPVSRAKWRRPRRRTEGVGRWRFDSGPRITSVEGRGKGGRGGGQMVARTKTPRAAWGGSGRGGVRDPGEVKLSRSVRR